MRDDICVYVGGWALALIDRTVLVFLSCLDSLDGNFAKTKQKKWFLGLFHSITPLY